LAEFYDHRGLIKVMKKWLSREKTSKKKYEGTGRITGFLDDSSTWKAGQGVMDDTAPQGVWYEVIFARRQKKA
jgi:hypothetical protein